MSMMTGELLPLGAVVKAVNRVTGRDYGLAVVIGYVRIHGTYDYETYCKLSDGSTIFLSPDEIQTTE